MAPAGSWAQKKVVTKEVVEEVVREYVKATGHKVVGVGSWIKGHYRDPLVFLKDASDHDLTLLLEGEDRRTLAQQWKKARDFFREHLEEKLRSQGLNRSQVERVLKSVNLYPPDQLLAGVTNTTEAKACFRRLKATPNLGGEPMEGLWGEGSLAFRQAYEAKSGRVFYRYRGTVYKGFVDLEHMARGYGTFSLAGTANLAGQFAQKAGKALSRGEAKEVYKNLLRLEQYLAKSESLARAQGPTATGSGKLARAIAAAQRDIDPILQSPLSPDQKRAKVAAILRDWLEEHRGLIDQALSESRQQVALCRALAATSDPRQMVRLRQMLEGGRWARLRRAVVKAWEKAGELGRRLPLHRLFQLAVGLMVVVEAHDLAATARQEGLRAALTKAGIKAVTYTNLPAAVVQAVLEEAQSAGVGLVTRFQDCLDLVAGIYAVKGRERVAPGRQIEELARDYLEEPLVRGLVELHARRAAQRVAADKATRAEHQTEQAIAERLSRRCVPVVVRAWRNRRLEMLARLMAAKQALDRALSHTLLVIRCQRVLRDGRMMLRAQAMPSTSRRRLLELLRQMEERLKALGGKRKQGFLMLEETYRWQVGKGLEAREQGVPLLGVPRPRFFGLGYTTYLPLPAGGDPSPTVTLHYTLKLRVHSPAPEVDRFLADLEGVYPFTSRAELEPPRWRAVVHGPRRLERGKSATLVGELLLDGEPVRAKGLSFLWSEASGLRLGRGRRISWAAERPGTHQVMLSVRGREGRELARASHQITVQEATSPLQVKLTAQSHHRGLRGVVRLTAEVQGGRRPFTLRVRILAPGGGLYRQASHTMTTRRTRISWGSQVSRPGVYRIMAQASDAQGHTSPWSPPVAITVEEARKPGPKPSPSAPHGKEKSKPGPPQWRRLGTFSGSFGGDQLYPGKLKPPVQGVHRVQVPGPGTLRVVFRHYPQEPCRKRYGIGCRAAARVNWESPKTVAGSGHFWGGGTYRVYYHNKRKYVEDLKEIVTSKSLRVRGAGTVTFKLQGDNCDGIIDPRFHGGKPYCCCSCTAKDFTRVLPARYQLEVSFAPAR
jgi:hypothetical protein